VNVDLTPAEAQYLSILAAADIRRDQANGLHGPPARHLPAWEKLQPACQWADDEPRWTP
jgi:hypothetical protein